MVSAIRAPAPSWLKTNYSCYCCPRVSMFILRSGVSLSIPVFSHHFPSLFYSTFHFGFPLLSFSRSFYFLYQPVFGLCSASSSSCPCKTSALNTCKGNLPLMCKTFPCRIQETSKLSAKSCQNTCKGHSHSTAWMSFSQEAELCCSCCSSSRPALQGTSRQFWTKWLKATAGSLQMAGGQGCTVGWPLNTLHGSDLYQHRAVLWISLKSKQILKNIPVSYSGATGCMWPIFLLSVVLCSDIRCGSLAYSAEKAF